MKPRFLKVGLVMVVAGALVWWAFHPRPSDRQLIAELVARAEHGVETKSVKEIMACVSPDYQDSAGLTRTDIWRLAHHWAGSSQEVDILIESSKVDIASPRAAGEFLVRLAELTRGEYELPGELRLRVSFEKQRRGWRKTWLVTSVEGHGLSEDFEGVL